MINEVMTAREAEKVYGLAQNTVAKWCQRGRFTDKEHRKSEKTWLVTKAGMQRLTKKEEVIMRLYYEDILVGEVLTNRSLSVEEALELVGFDEQKFLEENGFDEIDYNDFRMEY